MPGAALSFTFLSNNFIYASLFLAMLGFHCCSGFSRCGGEAAFSSSSAWVSHRGGVLVAEHGPWGMRASVAVALAQSLRLPRWETGSILRLPQALRHGLGALRPRALRHGSSVLFCGPTDLDAPQHMSSSQTWDWTRVSCIGKQTLHHWAVSVLPISTRRWSLRKSCISWVTRGRIPGWDLWSKRSSPYLDM